MEYQEEGVLLLSLIKARALNSQRITPLPAVPVPPPAANEGEVLLISRVMSLLHGRTRARAWEGPIDLDLMACNAFVKVILFRCCCFCLSEHFFFFFFFEGAASHAPPPW